MLTYILFLLIVLSGSIFGAAYARKRFEDTLPITTMSMVAVLFVFGLFGILSAGFLAVCLVALALYIAAAYRLFKYRLFTDLKQAFGSCGPLLFLLIFVALAVLNRGKVASRWDEYSHWMDITKTMTLIDDFGTNPNAQALFPSYPPGLALFEYFIQKLNLLIYPDAGFVEGLTYFSYQILFVSVFFPFFKKLSFKQPMSLALSLCAALLSALVFAPNLYATVYSDPLLGIFSAVGMARIFIDDDRSLCYHAYIGLLSVMLVLMKDAGLLFGVMLAAVYALDVCIRDFTAIKAAIRAIRNSGLRHLPKRRLLKAIGCCLVVLAPFLAKLLWSAEIKSSGCKVLFSGKVDLGVLVKVLTGREGGARAETLSNFVRELLFGSANIGSAGVAVNYYILFLLFAAAVYVLWKLSAHRGTLSSSKKLALIFALAQQLVYTAGLVIMYMFKFSEYEAVRLASFSRYLSVPMISLLLFVLLCTVDMIRDLSFRAKLRETFLLLALLIVIPIDGINAILRGNDISAEQRADYNTIAEQINTECDDASRVWFISQSNSGYDYNAVRYLTRRKTTEGCGVIGGNNRWSIGEPFYEGDIYTYSIDAETWGQELLDGYDYVALYRANEYFYEHFSGLFAEPEDIGDDRLYRLNRETGLLELCA